MLKFPCESSLTVRDRRKEIGPIPKSYGYAWKRTFELGLRLGMGLELRLELAFGLVFRLCIFTARCYASAVLAMVLCPSVRPSVCPSATSQSSTKTAKRRITQTTPHDKPRILVLWCQRSPRNSTGVTPYGGTKCRWGGSKSATFHK